MLVWGERCASVGRAVCWCGESGVLMWGERCAGVERVVCWCGERGVLVWGWQTGTIPSTNLLCGEACCPDVGQSPVHEAPGITEVN